MKLGSYLTALAVWLVMAPAVVSCQAPNVPIGHIAPITTTLSVIAAMAGLMLIRKL